MSKKQNFSQFFSGSKFMRLPLYKLVSGGLAVMLCAGLGVGVMATAANLPGGDKRPAATASPTPEPTPAVTPTATPESTPTPAPDKQVQADVTVVQQDIGILLYTLAPDKSADDEDAKQPLTGIALNVSVTDENGKVTECPLDTASGTALAEDVEPGDYTITLPETEGCIMPAAQTVTVKEKVVYKADTEAVKKKIVQSNAVVESKEDSSYGGGSVIANEVTDSVNYADSARTETGKKTTYKVNLSSDGYLKLKDGTVTNYRPVYDETTKELTGAVRTTTPGTNPVGFVGLDAGIVPLGQALNRTRRGQTEEIVPLEAEATPSAEPTPSAAPTPAPTEAPTEVPTQTPAPTETPTQTPEVTPTPTPTQVPTASPVPSNDPTSGLPEQIEAGKLAEYGFDVSTEEQTIYEYTGWQEVDGKNYYYDPSTHQPVTGSQVIQGNVYTFGADGVLNQTARGIDVSKFQGNIDWNAVKADGITFAIIRCGYRGYGTGALVEDSTFRANIKGATAAGIQVGVYFYSQATNEDEAVEEASMVLSLCSGYGLPVGVYYDTEKVAGDTGRADGLSAAERTACAVAFCETIRNGGYKAGVYSYASWFYNSLNFANISKYAIWIAQYRDSLSFSYHYNIWQYTSTGKVNGVPKAVDMNLG